MASSSDDKTIKIWDNSGTCLLTLRGHTASVRALIELQNGNLATGSEDRTVKIWNPYGQCLHTYLHSGWVSSLRELSDGTLVSDSHENRMIKRWDQNGNFLAALPGHRHFVDQAPLDLRDSILAGCADQNTINLWDSNNNLLRTLKGHTDCVKTLIGTQQGFLVSGSRDHTIRIWRF